MKHPETIALPSGRFLSVFKCKGGVKSVHFEVLTLSHFNNKQSLSVDRKDVSGQLKPKLSHLQLNDS